MSKSLGNSLTIRDALKMYNYEVLKYVMFSKHYGSDVDLSDKDYQLAESHMYYFYNTIAKMKEFIGLYDGKKEGEKLEDDISADIPQKFIDAMDDDFNTSAAIANLHVIFKYVNGIIKSANKGNRAKTANTLAQILEQMQESYGVLGLFKQKPNEFAEEMRKKYIKKIGLEISYIEEKIKERAEAKKNKQYDLADEIRTHLENQGIILNDTKEGTVWDIKELY